MSEYYAVVREGQDDHLEHLFGFGKKGSKKKNHKYFARVQVGSKYRYFYNPAEYAAYQAGKAAGGVASGAKSAAKSVDKAIGVGALIRKKKASKAFDAADKSQKHLFKMGTTMAATDPHYNPNGKLEKGINRKFLDATRAKNESSKKYAKASSDFDKSILGKVANSSAGKAVGKAASSVKKAAGKTKKKWDKLGYDVASTTTPPVQTGDNSYKVTHVNLKRKRNKLAKLLGINLKPWTMKDVDWGSATTVSGYKDEKGNMHWNAREHHGKTLHSRRPKIAEGTATIKKKKKVKSK